VEVLESLDKRDLWVCSMKASVLSQFIWLIAVRIAQLPQLLSGGLSPKGRKLG